MKRRFFVLAATIYQVPFIECAKELGLEVITLDNRPENPGHKLADRSFNINTTAVERVIEAAERENICGILSACTDVAVRPAAIVAERLGLPGPPVSAADIVCDKIAFRLWQKANGFSVPSFVVVNKSLNAASAMLEAGPLIIKPDRSSGCKGVVVVPDAKAAAARLPECLSFSPTGRGIVEGFILGHQITCEGVLRNGRIEHAWISDRLTPAPPFVTTLGHILPSALPASLQEQVRNELERAWSLLGVDHGPFDADLVVSEDKVTIIEMTPRVGGNSLSSIIKQSCGFDMVLYAVRYASQLAGDLPPVVALIPTASFLLGAEKAGILHYDRVKLRELQSKNWLHRLVIDYEPGSKVEAFSNGRLRLGEMLVTGDSAADLQSKRDFVRHQIDFRIL